MATRQPGSMLTDLPSPPNMADPDDAGGAEVFPAQSPSGDVTPARADDVEARARALLAQMTLEERLATMDGDLPFYAGLFALTRRDYYHRRPFPAGVNPRLGIGGVHFIDGPRGIVLRGGATTFPVAMARGASFDPALEERVGEAIGKELRSHGGNLFGGVCVNLLRHPAWGRAQETYGEDPVHLGQMGSALVRGVQRHAMACVKHLAANSMENARFTVDVCLSPRVLHELYLPHFKDCVDAGVACVMSAYNAVNGAWCGQSAELLTGVLRERWGFDGFVVSDWIFGVRDATDGARAGLDLEMPFRFVYRGGLREAVRTGRVPAEVVDRAVLRILKKQLAVRPAGGYPPSLRACPEHTALAREAAVRSMVLLRNEGDVLPIAEEQTVALFGTLAATPNLGDRGSSDGRPEYVVTPLEGLRAALGERLRYDDGGDLARAQELARRCDVAVVVVGYTHREEGEHIAPPSLDAFVGLVPPPPAVESLLARGPLRRLWTGLVRGLASLGLRHVRRSLDRGDPSFGAGGDRASLRLLPDQVALVRAVAEACPRTVVAIMAGSAVLTSEWEALVPGILLMWYPGMEGGHAFADLLTGHRSPCGRLPFTVPQSESDLPPFDRDATAVTYDMWHGYRRLHRDGNRPAYPFGFGLSYTRFSVSELTLASAVLTPEGELCASVTVQNVGARAGEELLQLYVGADDSCVERAAWELKAFTRVALAPGEQQRITLTVPAARLAYFDVEVDDFVVERTHYRVRIGRHACDDEAPVARFTIGP